MRWMKTTLKAAGAYELAWAAAVIFFPQATWRFLLPGMPEYLPIWQTVGMYAAMFGVAYLLAAIDPLRHWPIVAAGFIGKIIGPIGFLGAASQNAMPWEFGWTIITSDLLWLVPFGMILWKVWSDRHGDGVYTSPEEAMRSTRDQHGNTIAELSREQPRLLVFLRHNGCTFCREALADLRTRRADIQRAGVGIILVHMSNETEASEFFPSHGFHDVPRISDPERRHQPPRHPQPTFATILIQVVP